MALKPDAHDLLATALEAFRADVLPVVPAEKRYAALMIANALTMAAREFAAREGEAAPPQTAVLYEDAARLTAGEFEAASPPISRRAPSMRPARAAMLLSQRSRPSTPLASPSPIPSGFKAVELALTAARLPYGSMRWSTPSLRMR
jgi:hypothetical protein